MTPYSLPWPRHWGHSTLGEVTTKLTSGSRDWKPYYGRGTGVFILAQNVRMGRLDLAEPFLVDPPQDDPARTRSEVKEGDLLLTIVGNVGTVARVPVPLSDHFVCQSVALLRPGTALTSRFMELFLMAPSWGQAYFGDCTYGQGRPHLSFKDIKATPVPLPPLAEQDRIVAEVERLLDQSRQTAESLRTALHDIDLFEASVLHDAFDTNRTLMALGDVVDVRSGIGFPKHLQGRSAGAIPFGKVRDVSNAVARSGGLLSSTAHFVEESDLQELRGKTMPAGTVVMAKIGEGMRLNRRAVLTRPALMDNNVMGWVPNEDRIRSRFLYHWSKTQRLEDLARATAVPSVRKSDVVKLRIPVPPLGEQDRIVAEVEDRLARARAAADRIRAALANVERFEAAVLRDAFAGRLVPSDGGEAPDGDDSDPPVEPSESDGSDEVGSVSV